MPEQEDSTAAEVPEDPISQRTAVDSGFPEGVEAPLTFVEVARH
jgi:hypothetical protein